MHYLYHRRLVNRLQYRPDYLMSGERLTAGSRFLIGLGKKSGATGGEPHGLLMCGTTSTVWGGVLTTGASLRARSDRAPGGNTAPKPTPKIIPACGGSSYAFTGTEVDTGTQMLSKSKPSSTELTGTTQATGA